MTLACAFVSAVEPPVLFIAADSRLTLQHGHMDGFPKATELTESVALVYAGSTLLVLAAAEMTRWSAKTINICYRHDHQKSISLWDVARQYVENLVKAHHELRASNPSCDCLLVGRYPDSDSRPGIVRVTIDGHGTGAVSFYRPQPGKSVGVAVGEKEWIPLLAEVMRRAAKRPPHSPPIISALHGVIQHQGEPARTVGGGILFGFFVSGDGDLVPQELFSWPVIEIAGQRFLRGIEFGGTVTDAAIMRYEFDSEQFAELDRANAYGELEGNPIPDYQLAIDDFLELATQYPDRIPKPLEFILQDLQNRPPSA